MRILFCWSCVNRKRSPSARFPISKYRARLFAIALEPTPRPIRLQAHQINIKRLAASSDSKRLFYLFRFRVFSHCAPSIEGADAYLVPPPRRPFPLAPPVPLRFIQIKYLRNIVFAPGVFVLTWITQTHTDPDDIQHASQHPRGRWRVLPRLSCSVCIDIIMYDVFSLSLFVDAEPKTKSVSGTLSRNRTILSQPEK